MIVKPYRRSLWPDSYKAIPPIFTYQRLTTTRLCVQEFHLIGFLIIYTRVSESFLSRGDTLFKTDSTTKYYEYSL